MPSVSEIAKHAGVSKSTVSLALNNKPGVSKQMRARVLDALNELRAFEQSRQANNLPRPAEIGALNPATALETLSCLVLHPSILRSSQVFGELLQGIQAGAAARQIQLNLAVNQPDLPEDHITRLYFSDPALRPAGVLVIGAKEREPLVEEAHQLGLPVVLVGRYVPDPVLPIGVVGRDEEGAALEATRYLLELGHRAIAFVGGDPAYTYTQQRVSGYRRALQIWRAANPGAGIEPQVRWIALGEGQAAARQIIASSPEVTAVIFVNDAYAVAGLREFQAAGWHIPDRLSVISFDDTRQAQGFVPPLTSVLYPRFQEGLWSVKVLVDMIREPLMRRCQIVFQASLIKRESCAPPWRSSSS